MRSMADFIPPERVASHREALRDFRKAQENLAVRYNQEVQGPNPHGANRWLKALDQLGQIADVISLAAVAYDAKAAVDAGEHGAAQQMLTQWAMENAGAILAGRLASLAVAPLLAAGPLGWLVAGGVTLSASMIGSAYADEAAEFLAGHLVDLWDRGLDGLREGFEAAERTYSCPLVLDLDRNGVTTLAEEFAEIRFDHDRNGFAERTGWVSSTDGLLVRDLDGNGMIDHGGELFGNHTDLPDGNRAANGFEALRTLDSNGDHFIDHLDQEWSTLNVWIDGNSNGSVDSGELLSPQQAGVLRLGLDHAVSTLVDSHGHRHLQVGKFIATDGAAQAMHDVWFRVDQARTRWLHPVSVPASLASLPDLKGMGGVRDLHQAMALDSSGELRLLLERWIQGSSVQREALMDPLIFQWTGVSSMESGMDPGSVEGRLAVMERLLGQQYREGWAGPRLDALAESLLHQAYEAFRLNLENQLILQTDGWPILQQFIGPDGTVQSDASADALVLAAHYLDARFLQGSQYQTLSRMSQALRSLGDDGVVILNRLQEYASNQPFSHHPGLRLLSEYRLLKGTSSADHLHGSDGQDLIDGGKGDDVLYGGAGRDWLIAGGGGDYLNGGFGDDVYVIAAGGDRTTISDWDYGAGNHDQVLFTDVAAADVTLVERHGGHLYLHYGSGDRLGVENYFQSAAFRVEAFQFADGSQWGDGELRERAVVGGATAGNDLLGGYQDMANRIDGLEGNDQLYGGGFGDELMGGSGNDVLHGQDGDDHLDGGSGDDVLYGGAGRDWLIAGSGEDLLSGGFGDDVYVIAAGGDRKTISDWDYQAGNRDLVQFTDLKPSHVKLVERNDKQLLLHLAGGGELVVDLYFHSEAFRVEAFQFSNGTVWTDHQLRDRVVVGGATGGDDWLGGYNDMANRIKGLRGDDVLFGGVMNDALRGGSGNDTLHGGDGDDFLDGGSGDDVLYGGRGSDRLISGRGSDTLNGGEGDDSYVIVQSSALKQISDHDPNPSNHDIIYFNNLHSTDVISVLRHENHLEIKFTTSDQLLVSNYFLGASHRIEEFQFSNGIAWGHVDVLGLIPQV